MGVLMGVDPTRLDQAGWAIVFPATMEAAQRESVRSALEPLLDLRRSQAGEQYREFAGQDGYRPDESKSAFLARHGVGPGPVDPFKMPYYLLLLGDPESIPYQFERQLSVQYAVGHIDFGDDLDAYANYARSVVAAESGEVQRPRRAVFFGVENRDDDSTYLSANALVKPLAATLAREQPDWAIEVVRGDEATKVRLRRLLGGDDTPAVLFVASHGLAFPLGHPRQLECQGALLCQDWPGPRQWRGGIPRDFYVAADDLDPDAQPQGLIAFHYASYSAGTPRLDDLSGHVFKEPVAIAPHAFVARLPQRMLGHPSGGALAVVGLVDRASGFALTWVGLDVQRAVFESCLRQLMQGDPLGSAMEIFSRRYAELSTTLSAELEEIKFGAQPDPRALAGMWSAERDARSLFIVGDPAVRLPALDSATHQPEAAGQEGKP
jgi:hypothetical protein